MRITDSAEVERLLHVQPIVRARRQELVDRIARAGCLLRGHFALQSGNHSEFFLRFSDLGGIREHADAIATMITDDANLLRGSVRGVLCPESAGYFLGEAVARHLDVAPPVVARVDLRRHPIDRLCSEPPVRGGRYLLVNDVATSGESMRRLVAVARAHEVLVAGAAFFAASEHALASMGDTTYVTCLVKPRWPVHTTKECPACTRGEQNIIPALELN